MPDAFAFEPVDHGDGQFHFMRNGTCNYPRDSWLVSMDDVEAVRLEAIALHAGKAMDASPSSVMSGAFVELMYKKMAHHLVCPCCGEGPCDCYHPGTEEDDVSGRDLYFRAGIDVKHSSYASWTGDGPGRSNGPLNYFVLWKWRKLVMTESCRPKQPHTTVMASGDFSIDDDGSMTATEYRMSDGTPGMLFFYSWPINSWLAYLLGTVPGRMPSFCVTDDLDDNGMRYLYPVSRNLFDRNPEVAYARGNRILRMASASHASPWIASIDQLYLPGNEPLPISAEGRERLIRDFRESPMDSECRKRDGARSLYRLEDQRRLIRRPG